MGHGSIDEDFVLIQHFLHCPHEYLHRVHEAVTLVGHHIHFLHTRTILQVFLEAGNNSVD